MKTREEMIYDFMLALAPKLDDILQPMFVEYESDEDNNPYDFAKELKEVVYYRAQRLADLYLENIG